MDQKQMLLQLAEIVQKMLEASPAYNPEDRQKLIAMQAELKGAK